MKAFVGKSHNFGHMIGRTLDCRSSAAHECDAFGYVMSFLKDEGFCLSF